MNELNCRICGGQHLTGDPAHCKQVVDGNQFDPDQRLGRGYVIPGNVVKPKTSAIPDNPIDQQNAGFFPLHSIAHPSVDHTDKTPIVKMTRPATILETKSPVSVVEKRIKEISECLETNTPESRKKIAEVVLFNLRGTRTNRQLPSNDFNNISELKDAISSLSILQGNEAHTVMITIDKQGNYSAESARPSKIISIPLSGLKIAGRSAEIKLEIKFVSGNTDSGSFGVVDVKVSFDDQIGGGVSETSKPESLLGKVVGLFKKTIGSKNK